MTKQILFIACFSLLSFLATGQTTNPNYDSALAQSLGADDYGMKMYTMVLLKTGPNTVEDKAKRDSLFAGHLANIGRLAEMKKLVVAGPFGKNDAGLRGIFILNVSTTEAANELLQTDPAIAAGLLAPELYPWYGSAALPQYLDDHDKVWKTKF
jgi:uncharacterized protein YciI